MHRREQTRQHCASAVSAKHTTTCKHLLVAGIAQSWLCQLADWAVVYCVDLQHIDNLPREKAFFKGPAPLLLSSLSPDDLTFLLLGSDPKTSQVILTWTKSQNVNAPHVMRVVLENICRIRMWGLSV